MPLGKLSKMQIAKGFEVLEEIEAAINQKKSKACLEELSSKFFTTIPHNFGRNRPPTMDMGIVRQKKEMLMVRLVFLRLCCHKEPFCRSDQHYLLRFSVKVLADIELAQTLKSETEKFQEEIETVPHPIDQDYTSLNCNLSLMDKKAESFKVVRHLMRLIAPQLSCAV